MKVHKPRDCCDYIAIAYTKKIHLRISNSMYQLQFDLQLIVMPHISVLHHLHETIYTACTHSHMHLHVCIVTSMSVCAQCTLHAQYRQYIVQRYSINQFSCKLSENLFHLQMNVFHFLVLSCIALIQRRTILWRWNWFNIEKNP